VATPLCCVAPADCGSPLHSDKLDCCPLVSVSSLIVGFVSYAINMFSCWCLRNFHIWSTVFVVVLEDFQYTMLMEL
jgi:hypothetical protein